MALDDRSAIGTRMGVPFLLLSNQPDVRFWLSISFWFARVFRPIEDQYLPRRTFGGNQIGVLGHVSRLVDFSGVNYLLDDLNLGGGRDGVATHLSPFFVPVEGDIALREVECCDLKIILGLT